ncbi:MAG: hypothetical protein U0931_25060 [Vulcanimicrobiota bacterium]
MEFGPNIVREDDFLSPQECQHIADQVLALQPHWEARLGPYGFATLGCAAYLDVDDERYAEKSSLLNPLLRETFAPVYERVRTYFSQLLAEPAYYDEAYSYPGFHLFEFQGNETSADSPAERAHFDYQFAKVFPDFASTYLAPPLTFTLPIQEPSSGSSLEMWDLRPDGHAQINYEHKQYARNHSSRTVHYHVGRIFTHDGLNLHAMGRIAPGTVGRRMTLQGHAYKTERGWLLYW